MHNALKLALLIALPLFAQIAPNPKPSFEVISIKPTAPGNRGRGGGPSGNRFAMTGATLKMLLQAGYQRITPGLNAPFEIVGGPSWMDSDQYDVEAKADCSGGPISREQYQRMVQSLIEERFQLKAHLEPREIAVYELVVGKDGLKIKPTEDQSSVNPGGPNAPALCGPPPQSPPAPRTTPFDPTKMRGMLSMQYAAAGSTVTGNAVPVSMLMPLLRQETGRAIVDKTSLKELYDFKVRFRTVIATPSSQDPNAPAVAADPLPSLADALQQQLGLKLEPGKAQVEALVVESAQKPKEN